MGGGRTVRYSLAGFARFCSALVLDDGKPFALQPFQRKMLADYFAGSTETVIVIPKKNGKTTLLAALALYHLENTPNAECLIVASSRDQARILFNQAAELVRRSRLEGRFEVKTGYGIIWPPGGDSAGPKIAVKPAEAGTGDGVIPTLALVDELHRHKNLDLYGVLRDGLLGDSRMVTISTAGASEENPLWTIREQARSFPTFRRRGAYSTARSGDGSFVLHEWSLENTADLADMRLVKTANPAPWHTLASLRRRHDSPTMTSSQWARFAAGVWTFGERPWIEPQEWDRLAVDIGRVVDGEAVVLSVSTGSGGAGIAIVAPRDDGAVAASASIASGDIPLELVERTLVGLAERYSVRECSYDRVEFQRSAELLEARGLPMVEIPHSPERLSIASTTLQSLVASGKLHHDGAADLRRAVLQGSTKDSERGWRFVKTPGTRPLIALAIAAHQATQVAPEPPAFIAL